MNKIIIMGRLTRDPELTTTQSGIEKCRYTVAVDEPKDKNGEKKVNFFNCVAFGKSGAFVSKYFKKGDGIIVIGRMDSYKGNDEKTYWNIIAESHDFPLGRSSGSAQAPAPVVDAASGMPVVETEELPF
jgi:single-strand DNA-binding protein